MNNTELTANALSRAVRLGLIAGVAATAAASLPVAPAIAQDDSAAALDRIEVTGSRIKRTDIEGALPVTVITREQIQLSGDTSVADFLRNTTFNSFGSFRPQSGSSAQSFAGLSLRGLGTSRTLILIDGRRAPTAPNVGSAQDLNSIPLAAVERIEILSDGASAIYGSDAIGGVVNIITRRDFNGVEISAGISNPKQAGGETEEGSVTFGVSSNRGSLLAGASYNTRGIVFQREREWSRGGGSVFSNNMSVAIPTRANPDPNNPAHWRPNTAAAGYLLHPTFGSVPPGGCSAPGFSVIPTTQSGQATQRCLYDFTLQAADEAEIRNQSFFARANFQINDDWSTYLNTTVGRVKSFGRYAPVPSSPWPGGLPFLAPNSPNHPANRFPNDPFYQTLANQPIYLRHRFASLGPRDNTVDSNTYDVLLGFEGRVGDFDLDFGVRNSEFAYLGLGRNYVVGGLAQGFISSGAYNIYNPFAAPASVRNSMIATTSRESNFKLQEVFAVASTNLWEIGGGQVGLAFGAEFRKEDYLDLYDSLSEGGQVVGSSGNSAGGGRNARAAFFEALFPVLDNFDITVAGRMDKYSDYGSDFSPKIAFRYQPLDSLTLRASYGEGFRAPPLSILTQKPSFSADAVANPAICAAAGIPAAQCQIEAWVISNPNLDSENSEQWSVGLAWEATDFFNMSVDYYDITIKNQIANIGTTTLFNCLILQSTTNCPPGLSFFPATTVPPNPGLGLGIARDAQGGVLFVQRGSGNFGTVETSGVDMNLRTNFDLADFGGLRNELQIGYVRDYRSNRGRNIVGDSGVPKYRATLSNVWSYGDFGVAWNVNYVHNTLSEQGQILRANGPNYGLPARTPSWTTHDLQANWEAPWNGRVTIGVQNVMDRDPPLDDLLGRGFDFSLYDGYGRVPYLRYTQTF